MTSDAVFGRARCGCKVRGYPNKWNALKDIEIDFCPTHSSKTTLVDATEAQIQIAKKRALRRAHCTEEELVAMAATGSFPTLQARLAWMVIKPLRGKE